MKQAHIHHAAAAGYQIPFTGRTCYLVDWLYHQSWVFPMALIEKYTRWQAQAQAALQYMQHIHHTANELHELRQQRPPPKKIQDFFVWGKQAFQHYIHAYSRQYPLNYAFAVGFEAGDWRASLFFVLTLLENQHIIDSLALQKQLQALKQRMNNRQKTFESYLVHLPAIYQQLHACMCSLNTQADLQYTDQLHSLITEWEHTTRQVFSIAETEP